MFLLPNILGGFDKMVVVTKRTSGVPEILAQNSRLSCWRIESAEQQCTQLGGAQPFSNGPRINLLIKPESIIFAPMIPDSLNIPAIITIPSFEMQGVFLVIGFLKSMGRTPFPEKTFNKTNDHRILFSICKFTHPGAHSMPNCR